MNGLEKTLLVLCSGCTDNYVRLTEYFISLYLLSFVGHCM